MLATTNRSEVRKMPYWLNVLIAIDQLGNAIAGGNPDNTISGRVGFFASDLHMSKIKGYWKALERIIDFTFEPIQGRGHCFQAWQGEPDETDTEVTYITRILLGIFVALGCFFISIAIRVGILINPSWRYKAESQHYNSWREARQTSVKKHVPVSSALSSTAPIP